MGALTPDSLSLMGEASLLYYAGNHSLSIMAHYGGGASHLAAIYGSEQDKVNCSFYLKIGACRHGERCSRKHIKPQYSQTIVILNMYTNPQNTAQSADGS